MRVAAVLLAAGLVAAQSAPAAAPAPAYTPSANDQLYAQLKGLPTQVERIKLLSNDSQFVFNFLDPNAERTKGAGGFIVLANAATFPALYSHGMSMSLGVLGPCTVNSPHTHPRATEFNVALNGTLHTGMLAENNARFIVNEVGVLSATFFPRGAIHFEANLGCDPVYFIAAFSDEDPGVLQVAQRFFGLPPDIVGDSMGGLGVEQVAGLASLIPDNVIFAGQDCFQRCGLTMPPQPTLQQQPRVSGNALPTSTAAIFMPNGAAPSAAPAAAPPAMAPAPPAAAAPAPAPSAGAANVGGGYPYPASSNSGSGSSNSGGTQPYPGYYSGTSNAAMGGHPVVALADPTSGSTSDSDSMIRTLIIAVLAINGVLVLGILGGILFFVCRRRRDQPGSQRLMGMAGGPRGSYMRTGGKGDEVVFSMPDESPSEHKMSSSGPDAGPPAAQSGWYSDPYAGESRTSLDRTTMPPREDAPQRGRASY